MSFCCYRGFSLNYADATIIRTVTSQGVHRYATSTFNRTANSQEALGRSLRSEGNARVKGIR